MNLANTTYKVQHLTKCIFFVTFFVKLKTEIRLVLELLKKKNVILTSLCNGVVKVTLVTTFYYC